ncbi:hypothetical protein [Agathobacter rectalis]|uniref:hypothetical protein n=1 Tax=Agathobacter rectalis TaxID=39491 RepID=UPI0027D32523|nr:hypothetical protein [Agathobacter rectalis]
MIIKIEAVPKLAVEDGVEKVVMGENNQPVWDKERALITTKGGNYRRIVTLTDELAAEVAKGHRYFNAVEKNGKLHITGECPPDFKEADDDSKERRRVSRPNSRGSNPPCNAWRKTGLYLLQNLRGTAGLHHRA